MGKLIPILIVLGIVGMVAFMFIAVAMSENQKYKPVSGDLAKQAKRYNFFNENFLTRKTFRKIVEQLASLSIYSTLEVRKLAIKYYTRSAAMSALVVILGIVIYRDLVAVALCIELAIIMFQALIVNSLDVAHKRIINEFSYMLASLRESYTVTGNIPDAVSECNKGKHLQQAMDKIYLILTSTDADDLLEDFYLSVPFPMLQTLAGLCYLMNDAGDEKDDSGQSAFKTAVTLIKDECDADVRHFTRQHEMFKYVQVIPLIPPLAAGVLRYFVTIEMPGASSIYNGMYGYLCQVVAIIAAAVGFWYVGHVTSPSTIRRRDRSELIDKFVFWKPLQGIVKNIMPKYGKQIRGLENRINAAVSSKDIRYIYTAKVMASVLTCVGVFIAIMLFTTTSRTFIYNNIKTSSLAAGNNKITVEDAGYWHEIDNKVMASKEPPREHDLRVTISKYFPVITAMDMSDQCSRIISKYAKYHGLKFRWWYLLIVFGGSVASWYAQDLALWLRARRVKWDEEEDVLQIQTMLAVLRYTNLTTLDALFWMARQSRLYKSALLFAYYEYPSDPELAITRLSDKSRLPAFKLICQRLLNTVSDITIREAFSDLESERHHMLSVRETIQKSLLERQRKTCSPFVRAPLYIVAVGYFVVPILILAVTSGLDMLKQIGVMG